jgi:acyl-CoA synthetase (AMP-forming)/AMP-acid ligase II
MSLADLNDSPCVNIASYLAAAAKNRPYRRAVVCPARRDTSGLVTYSHLTFLQLEQESDGLAHGLQDAGVTRGTRTVIMVKQTLDFFVLIFALFKTGAIPVVVDPGMGIRRMVACFQSTRPTAFIGIPSAHVVRTFYPKFFQTVKTWITVGRRWFWGGSTLDRIRPTKWDPYPMAPTRRDEMAAILFTTGSTGPAKGAVYTHGNFDAQLQQIKAYLNMSEEEIDLSTFPLFALFYPALGTTAVIPDMNPTRPAKVNPQRIIEAIHNHGVTNMFASPALLNRVGRYGRAKGIKLPSLKRVICAGAPVSAGNIEGFSSMLGGDAEIHTPYGATEAVPIISIKSKEILSETSRLSREGYGICIGRPLDAVTVEIIKISDDPIETWSEELLATKGEVGEIAVKGALVSRHYFNNPEADLLTKIKDGNGFWHRMGDLGWMDTKGRIWFCGRKSQRVITAEETLLTIPCEAIINLHPRVFRSALVGVGLRPNQKPVIVVELDKSDQGQHKNRLKQELLNLAASHKLTKNIQTVLFHKAFPVDIRHNSKIFREKLAAWVQKKLK